MERGEAKASSQIISNHCYTELETTYVYQIWPEGRLTLVKVSQEVGKEFTPLNLMQVHFIRLEGRSEAERGKRILTMGNFRPLFLSYEEQL